MKFSLENLQTPATSTAPQVTIEDVAVAYEGLLSTYMELSDAQRNLDEVCQVMENLTLSIEMLKTGGSEAIKILNADKSIENLINVDISKATVESVTESLEGATNSAWTKFVEMVKAVYRKVVAFFKSIFYKTGMVWDGQRLDELRKLVENSDYNNLWAGGFEPYSFQNEDSVFEYTYTKDGFKRLVDLFEKIVPAYLKYATVLEHAVGKVSGVEDVQNASDEISSARNEFLTFLTKTELGRTLDDGKPFISDDVELATQAYDIRHSSEKQDLGWKSKNDVLATIGDLERLQKLKGQAAAWIPLVDKIEQTINKLSKPTDFLSATKALHDIFDTSKVTVIDSAKVMGKMTMVYSRMVNQMIAIVKHFYSASK